MNTTLMTIATQTLARIEEGRKLKARCGLEDDTLRVTIVGMNETHCDAMVRNGDGQYEVFVSEHVSTCTCKDCEFRNLPCKHIAATAMMLLGATTPAAKQPFSCGDLVQLRGLPAGAGKIVCVSCDMISVSWPTQGTKLARTSAYHAVELERVSYLSEQRKAA